MRSAACRLATLGHYVGTRGKSIEPAKQPEEWFELYSVPSHPTGVPEIVQGSQIGSNKQIVEPGSVLLGKINPRINRTWVVFSYSDHPKIASTEWIVFPPSHDYEPKFLAYYLQQESVRSFLASNASGVGGSLMRVKPSTLASFPFLLPASLETQRSVVSEIEKQFTRLDAGVAALKRVQANLKRYRASVLKAACEGRLVPTEAELARQEGRTYETGAQLLARILEERRASWSGKGKYKEPPPPDTTNLPEMPDGWAWASLDQLVGSPLCNGVSIKGQDEPPGVRALKLSAMSDHGFDYTDIRYLPLKAAASKGIWIQRGDFFVSRGNGSLHLVGRGTVAQEPPEPTIFPDTMIRLRFGPVIRGAGWPNLLWPSRLVRTQIESLVKTTAGIYKISQPQLGSIALPLPPLAEQERIVAECGRRLSVSDAIEATLTATFRRATGLRQSVLREAFSRGDGG